MNYKDLVERGFILFTTKEEKASSVALDLVTQLGLQGIQFIDKIEEPHDYTIKFDKARQRLYYCDIHKDVDISAIHFYNMDTESVSPIRETDVVNPPCKVYLYKQDIFNGIIVLPSEETEHTIAIPQNTIAIDIQTGKVSLTDELRLPSPITTYTCKAYTIKSDCIDTFIQSTNSASVDLNHIQKAPKIAYDAYHLMHGHIHAMPRKMKIELMENTDLVLSQYTDLLNHICKEIKQC